MSAEVRKVLLRVQRNLRKYERAWSEGKTAPAKGVAHGLGIAVTEVLTQLQKLDRPRKRATKKAARKQC